MRETSGLRIKSMLVIDIMLSYMKEYVLSLLNVLILCNTFRFFTQNMEEKGSMATNMKYYVNVCMAVGDIGALT